MNGIKFNIKTQSLRQTIERRKREQKKHCAPFHGKVKELTLHRLPSSTNRCIFASIHLCGSFLFLVAIFFSQVICNAEGPDSQRTGTSNTSSSKAELSGIQLDSIATNRPKNAQTEITANDQATFNSQTNIAEFKGSVAVNDPQFTLNCERLRAVLSQNRKGLERVEAYGDVVIRQENTNARGEKIVSLARAEAATYEPSTGNITLFKWPQIEQGINRHVSTDKDTKMILNREGRISTVGASKTVIVDQSGGGMQNAW